VRNNVFDIVLPVLRIAVFVHGCFWHRHKNCRFTTSPKSNSEFWVRKFARTVERDREHVRALKKSGWRVVTVWECNAKRSPDAVPNKLLRAIKASRLSRSNAASAKKYRFSYLTMSSPGFVDASKGAKVDGCSIISDGRIFAAGAKRNSPRL
jgi:G:T-mismatch repair DNA endonuclease (very short patch repair protein)